MTKQPTPVERAREEFLDAASAFGRVLSDPANHTMHQEYESGQKFRDAFKEYRGAVICATEEARRSCGASAPPNEIRSVTEDDLDKEIETAYFFTGHEAASRLGYPNDASMKLLPLCILRLHNGFTVVGQSACVDPKKFDAGIGRKLALADARAKLWPLLGFRLADDIHAGW